MEAQWVADRALLRELCQRQPPWTNQQFAETMGRSATWVKKWKKRLAEGEADDDRVLFSRSRARHHPPEANSQPVVEAILAIRDHPPDELQRTPGPLAILIGVEPIICPPHQPQKNPFVERFHRSYDEECIQTKAPATLRDVQEVNDWYHHHYNVQRPHQGLCCGNQPPCVAFPALPSLPPLPDRIDPDAWVDHIVGRYYRRRITSNGTLQIGGHAYYIGTRYQGQAVAITVRPQVKIFDVILGTRVIKSLCIKGLCDQMMPLDEYIPHICREAESEYRRYLASSRRYSQ